VQRHVFRPCLRVVISVGLATSIAAAAPPAPAGAVPLRSTVMQVNQPVALGALPKGDYVVKLREVALTYSDEGHPERATRPTRLFEAQGLPFQVH
jgi:hypothetical protein